MSEIKEKQGTGVRLKKPLSKCETHFVEIIPGKVKHHSYSILISNPISLPFPIPRINFVRAGRICNNRIAYTKMRSNIN
jgi:hypothetical protein